MITITLIVIIGVISPVFTFSVLFVVVVELLPPELDGFITVITGGCCGFGAGGCGAGGWGAGGCGSVGFSSFILSQWYLI